jgi:hypothetical protein
MGRSEPPIQMRLQMFRSPDATTPGPPCQRKRPHRNSDCRRLKNFVKIWSVGARQTMSMPAERNASTTAAQTGLSITPNGSKTKTAKLACFAMGDNSDYILFGARRAGASRARRIDKEIPVY